MGAASLFLFLLFDPDDRKNLSDIIARKYSRSLSDLHTHRERERRRERRREGGLGKVKEKMRKPRGLLQLLLLLLLPSFLFDFSTSFYFSLLYFLLG